MNASFRKLVACTTATMLLIASGCSGGGKPGTGSGTGAASAVPTPTASTPSVSDSPAASTAHSTAPATASAAAPSNPTASNPAAVDQKSETITFRPPPIDDPKLRDQLQSVTNHQYNSGTAIGEGVSKKTKELTPEEKTAAIERALEAAPKSLTNETAKPK